MLFLGHVSRNESPIELVQAIHQHYLQPPGQNRMVWIADGPVSSNWCNSCWGKGIQIIQGSSLKHLQHGTAWLRRWIDVAIESGEDLIIKIDADCTLHRPFAMPPPADIAGHAACHLLNQHQYVRGGAVVYRRSALITIRDSGLLDSEEYICPRRFAYYNQRQLLHSEDQTIAAIAKRLGLSIVPWMEVYNVWRGKPPNLEQYAITASPGWSLNRG